jgi:hypothetical protein
MMKRVLLVVLSLGWLGVWLMAADGPLTPLMQLRARTDANGYLMTVGGAYTAADGPLTPMANLRGRTDSNGYLLTAFTGGAISGVTTFPDGTSGAPSIAFTSEPTLGLWRSSAAVMQIQGGLNVTGSIIGSANVIAAQTQGLAVSTRLFITAPADGNAALTNWGATIGSRLKVDALPTPGTCGTSPAVTAGSTPFAGSIDVGTATPASCVVVFGGTAFPSAPFCTANAVTSTAGTTRAIGTLSTTSQLTLTPATAFADSTVVAWHCVSSK